MKATMYRQLVGAAAVTMALAGMQGAWAQSGAPRSATPPTESARSDGSAIVDGVRDARDDVYDAMAVVQQMKGDAGMQSLLNRAKGVFIVHHYARGGFGVGAQIGEGILLTRGGKGEWSNPVFYNLGGLSVGPQIGGAGGSMVMVLTSDRALRAFDSTNKFSLNADATLTIARYDGRAHATTAQPVNDAVVWSDVKGAYAGATIGATDVMFDRDENRAYYGRDDVSPRAILDGSIDNPHSNVLSRVLVASRSSDARSAMAARSDARSGDRGADGRAPIVAVTRPDRSVR